MAAFWKGFGVVEFVTCAALATAVSFGFIPRLVRSAEHTRISRAYRELRQTAIALAAYNVDHRAFPPSARAVPPIGNSSALSPSTETLSAAGTGPLTPNSDAPPGAGSGRLMTFRLPRTEWGETFGTLTSPIAYLDELPVDPFSHTIGSPLGYFAPSDGSGWILFSLGPDRDENAASGPGDISPWVEALAAEFLKASGTPGSNDALSRVTYDPSNGTFSNGDLWWYGARDRDYSSKGKSLSRIRHDDRSKVNRSPG
jgi:hypothetical protein